VIETMYRVEVAVPRPLLELYGRDTDFVFALTQATRGHSAAGRGASEQHGPFEWAEFGDKLVAEHCERELMATVARFEARLSTWQQQTQSQTRWQRGGAGAGAGAGSVAASGAHPSEAAALP
jgi:hypothetical protein